MADGQRSLAGLGRDIDRLERRQDEHERDVRDHYVRRDVYEANERARDAHDRRQDERIGRMENDDTSRASGTRTWLLGLVQMILAVILGAVAAWLTSKGAH